MPRALGTEVKCTACRAQGMATSLPGVPPTWAISCALATLKIHFQLCDRTKGTHGGHVGYLRLVPVRLVLLHGPRMPSAMPSAARRGPTKASSWWFPRPGGTSFRDFSIATSAADVRSRWSASGGSVTSLSRGQDGAALGGLGDAAPGGVLGHADVEDEALLGGDQGHGALRTAADSCDLVAPPQGVRGPGHA